MSPRLRVGISTCPNDTFAFHGLLTGAVGARGLELEIELADVEALNGRLEEGTLDVGKASFAAALGLAREYVVLPVGAAVGFGVGPVLLAREAKALPPASARPAPLVLCPGERTTAHLLYRMLHQGVGRIEQVVFSEIMPALSAGRADFGVCIHEGRFAWRERGLFLVEDLGASWEARTRSALPLGGILARRALGRDVLARLSAAIRASLDHARAHPDEALATMRRHAQEEGDEHLWAHVELYVNEWTRELGSVGRAALAAFEREASAAGFAPAGGAPLEVFDG